MAYYQNIDTVIGDKKTNSYEIKIQPDDLLKIIVSADDPETALSFNLSTAGVSSISNTTSQEAMEYYLVDAYGNIDFPILGKLKVSGLSRTEILALLQEKISKYIKNPIVNLRIMNFKVSVQGEVSSPGVFSVESDRFTLIEAISRAGDLTIYGVRENILIIREIDGVKSFNRVDITKADFMNSPFYYLAQNDVVYVEPNKVQMNAAAVGTSTGLIFSVISLAITLFSLSYSLIK